MKLQVFTVHARGRYRGESLGNVFSRNKRRRLGIAFSDSRLWRIANSSRSGGYETDETARNLSRMFFTKETIIWNLSFSETFVAHSFRLDEISRFDSLRSSLNISLTFCQRELLLDCDFHPLCENGRSQKDLQLPPRYSRPANPHIAA